MHGTAAFLDPAIEVTQLHAALGIGDRAGVAVRVAVEAAAACGIILTHFIQHIGQPMRDLLLAHVAFQLIAEPYGLGFAAGAGLVLQVTAADRAVGSQIDALLDILLMGRGFILIAVTAVLAGLGNEYTTGAILSALQQLTIGGLIAVAGGIITAAVGIQQFIAQVVGVGIVPGALTASLGIHLIILTELLHAAGLTPFLLEIVGIAVGLVFPPGVTLGILTAFIPIHISKLSAGTAADPQLAAAGALQLQVDDLHIPAGVPEAAGGGGGVAVTAGKVCNIAIQAAAALERPVHHLVGVGLLTDRAIQCQQHLIIPGHR